MEFSYGPKAWLIMFLNTELCFQKSLQNMLCVSPVTQNHMNLTSLCGLPGPRRELIMYDVKAWKRRFSCHCAENGADVKKLHGHAELSNALSPFVEGMRAMNG